MKSVLVLLLACEALASPAGWSFSIPANPNLNPNPIFIPNPTPNIRIPSPISLGKGSVVKSPLYLSGNYIPAAMHVLFHLSDLMKYEVRPPASTTPSSGSTSTTVRPTQPHKPGNYAPERPYSYFSDQSGPESWSFGWGRIAESLNPEEFPRSPSRQQEDLPVDIELFGAGPSELLHQINTLEDSDTIGDEDDDVQIRKFSINYEDTVNLDFLRQKRIPPTKAYVTVLSLFDLLNKESKELGLNKYNGYSENMLRELKETSEGTSSDQLKFVLTKIIDKRNTRKDNILKKIKQLLIDLEKPDSYINMAIRYIPALQFSL